MIHKIMNTPFPPSATGELLRVLRTDPLVNLAWKQGLSLEQTIVALSDMKTKLEERVVELSSITPKVIRDSDGNLLRWDCPTEFLTVD